MDNSNYKKIVKLYNHYRNIKKNVGVIKLRTKDFYEIVTREYNLEEVVILKAIDGNYYIRLLCSYKDGFNVKKSFRYFNDKNQQVSFAQFSAKDAETYIDLIHTKNKFRHKGLVRNAMLKIEDYSIKNNKAKPLHLLCIKRNGEETTNKNYKMYQKMGFSNVYNESISCDAIYMEKDLRAKTERRKNLIINKNIGK